MTPQEAVQHLNSAVMVVQAISKELQNSALAIERVRIHNEALTREVAALTAVISGERGLLTRIAVLEEKLQHVKHSVSESDSEGRVAARGRWEFWIAVVSGISAVLSALAAAAVQYSK